MAVKKCSTSPKIIFTNLSLIYAYYPFQELKERVSSHTLKVIVVKKGQLKLYAGQPLPDVEMALRSLVGQN